MISCFERRIENSDDKFFFLLILSLFCVSLIPLTFWLTFKKDNPFKKNKNKWKKKRKFKQLIIKIVLSSSFSLFILWISIHLQIPIIQDVPNVLLHNTKTVEGNCKIDIISGRGGGDLVVLVRKHNIFFVKNPYHKAKNGSYYCRVEYLPHSEMGVSLKLYQTRNGKEIKIK